MASEWSKNTEATPNRHNLRPHGNENNTAVYHRHIFRPPILLKMPLKSMKAFFFQKLSNFCNFSTSWNFQILLQKTSQLKWTKHFQEKLSFDTHSTANLPPSPIFSNSKENPTSVRIWEILLSQSHSTSNLLQFGDKNFQLQERAHGTFSIGK